MSASRRRRLLTARQGPGERRAAQSPRASLPSCRSPCHCHAAARALTRWSRDLRTAPTLEGRHLCSLLRPADFHRASFRGILFETTQRRRCDSSLRDEPRLTSSAARHQHTYHGVLAPAAAYRDLIVPGPRVSRDACPSGSSATSSTPARHSSATRSTWAELLLRVFATDVFECPHCGGRRKLIALISDGVVVPKILDHLGLPTEPPKLAPARVCLELASKP